MYVALEVDLNEDECRHLLTHLVPNTATAVTVAVRARINGETDAIKGTVSLQYLGRKKDGTVHKRRTGQWWNLTDAWWTSLVQNNTKLPLTMRLALKDLTTTRATQSRIEKLMAGDTDAVSAASAP